MIKLSCVKIWLTFYYIPFKISNKLSATQTSISVLHVEACTGGKLQASWSIFTFTAQKSWQTAGAWKQHWKNNVLTNMIKLSVLSHLRSKNSSGCSTTSGRTTRAAVLSNIISEEIQTQGCHILLASTHLSFLPHLRHSRSWWEGLKGGHAGSDQQRYHRKPMTFSDFGRIQTELNYK